MIAHTTKEFKMKEKEAGTLTGPMKALIKEFRTSNHNKKASLDLLDSLIQTAKEVDEEPDSEELVNIMVEQVTEAKKKNKELRDETDNLFKKDNRGRHR